jgi:hypothetical protein
MNKLHISYNVFDDSLELLEESILSIKDSVDEISIIYQTISNVGNLATEDIEGFLYNLKEKELINYLIKYNPDLKKPSYFNEITKRNLGLYTAKRYNSTHFMTMDCDEIYNPDEFKKMKEKVYSGDYDSSFCQMQTYYKTKEYVLDPPEDYYVPLIYKISENEFIYGIHQSVLCDPTRRIKEGKSLILTREEIEMHHYSHIRKDYRKKLINSSALVNFKNSIEELVEYHKNWEYPNDIFIPGLPPKKWKIKKYDK